MRVIQSRRDFLAGLVGGRFRVRPRRPRIARRRAAAGDDHDPAVRDPEHLHSALVYRRRPAPRGRLHRDPLRIRRSGVGDEPTAGRKRRDRLRLIFPPAL